MNLSARRKRLPYILILLSLTSFPRGSIAAPAGAGQAPGASEVKLNICAYAEHLVQTCFLDKTPRIPCPLESAEKAIRSEFLPKYNAPLTEEKKGALVKKLLSACQLGCNIKRAKDLIPTQDVICNTVGLAEHPHRPTPENTKSPKRPGKMRERQRSIDSSTTEVESL